MSPPSDSRGPPGSSDAEKPAVVIACAAADLATVRPAAQALEHRGHTVDLVSGVEGDTELLAAVIRKLDRQGLYVLCRSKGLDRQGVDKLRALLRSHEVPFGRTLTLALEAGRPRALEERIVSVARRMITGRSDSGPSRQLPRPAPKPRAPIEPDDIDTAVDRGKRRESIDEDEVAQWADSLVGKAPRPPDYESETPTAVDGGVKYPVDGLGEPDITEPAPSDMLRVDKHDNTQPGYNKAEATSVTTAPEEPLTEKRIMPPSGVDKTVVAPAPKPPPPSGSTTLKADAIPRAQTAGQPGEGDDDVEIDFRPGGKVPLVLAGVAALVLVVVVIALASTGGDDDKGTGKGKEKDKANVVAKTDDTKVEKKDAEPEIKQDEPDKGPNIVSAAADEGAGDQGEPEEPVPPAPEPPPEMKAQVPPPAQPAASAPSAPPEPPEPSRVDLPPPEVEDDALVVAALRSRDVRAWHRYLVTADPTKEVPHQTAMAYCNALDVGGLSGWRLPTVGELYSLGNAKMVRAGDYWSDTDGDAFAKTRLVLTTKRLVLRPVGTGRDDARAICIRDRS